MMKRTRKLIKGLVPIVLVSMLVFGVSAQIMAYFGSGDYEVTVTGLEIDMDGNLLQNYQWNQPVAMYAGTTYIETHNLTYTDGDPTNVTVTFTITGECEGLTMWVQNNSTPITEIALEKYVPTEVSFHIETDAMFESSVHNLNVNITS